MTQSPQAWTVLAHLLRPQGRKGELLAELLTDFPERFAQQPRVFLAAPGFRGQPDEARSIEVAASWLPVGKNEGRIVLHFAGVDSISSAEALAGLEVIVPREERKPLEEESVYIGELVGCTLYDRAAALGIIEDVQFAMTPDGTRRLEDAAPLLSVMSPDGEEILVPFVKAFLVKIDTEARRIEMTLPEGLVEVNRTRTRITEAGM
ncbi:MAG: ribosome maturation factor RimM [Acidobacteriota bacterium]|nr:ribosome maturation factor RimM [Acidobacteriota bacterium]